MNSRIFKAILVVAVLLACSNPVYAGMKKSASSKGASSGSPCTFKQSCRNWQNKWMRAPRKRHTDSSYMQTSSAKPVK